MTCWKKRRDDDQFSEYGVENKHAWKIIKTTTNRKSALWAEIAANNFGGKKMRVAGSHETRINKNSPKIFSVSSLQRRAQWKMENSPESARETDSNWAGNTVVLRFSLFCFEKLMCMEDFSSFSHSKNKTFGKEPHLLNSKTGFACKGIQVTHPTLSKISTVLQIDCKWQLTYLVQGLSGWQLRVVIVCVHFKQFLQIYPIKI